MHIRHTAGVSDRRQARCSFGALVTKAPASAQGDLQVGDRVRVSGPSPLLERDC